MLIHIKSDWSAKVMQGQVNSGYVKLGLVMSFWPG
jgi:hypothetical protein